jgi:hypothetical protein
MSRSGGTLVPGGRTIGTGARGQLRNQQLTQILISILNEADPTDPQQRPKLYRVCENLIAQATTALDKYKTKTVLRRGKGGKVIEVEIKTNEIEEKGIGDLMAIKEIFDRIDGKPKQVIVGPNDGPIQIEYRSIEEIRVAMLEKGIDLTALPVPLPQLTQVRRDDD